MGLGLVFVTTGLLSLILFREDSTRINTKATRYMHDLLSQYMVEKLRL